MASTNDASLIKTNPFHEWWLGELRTSLSPAAIDTEPKAAAPSPPESRARLPVLFFACTLGLVGGAATMLLLDTRTTTPNVVHAAAAPAPQPVVEGIVEIGEIIVVSTPAVPESKKAKRTSKPR